MADRVVTPGAEDLFSVGSRISWPAIFGGGLVALALYFMFTTLGAAVGLSISDSVNPSNLTIGAMAWTILTMAVSLFVGGVMASLFTVGENKVEAVFYGVIMWAFLLTVLLILGAIGTRSGMVALAHLGQAAATPDWEANARAAGVSQEAIDEWRRKTQATAARLNDPQTQAEIKKGATRAAWFAFAGTWISMLAAAGGSFVGAGPTFRIVPVSVTRG